MKPTLKKLLLFLAIMIMVLTGQPGRLERAHSFVLTKEAHVLGIVDNHRDIIVDSDPAPVPAAEQRDTQKPIRDRQVLARGSRGNTNSSSRQEGMAFCQTKWSGEDCEKLDFIITKESGWVVGIWNSSGCAGLGQACPASKLGDAYGSLIGELTWAMDYCLGRYGSIDQAYNFWISHGWW